MQLSACLFTKHNIPTALIWTYCKLPPACRFVEEKRKFVKRWGVLQMMCNTTMHVYRPIPKGVMGGLCLNPPLKLMIFIKDVSLTRTANRGPYAVSVVLLRGSWWTLWLRPDHFGTRKMLFSIENFRWTLLYNALWAMSRRSSTFWPTRGLLKDCVWSACWSRLKRPWRYMYAHCQYCIVR